MKRTTVPLPGRGLDRDVAARVGDDAVHGREAEPGALARGLRGEERLEGAVGDVGLHAGALVGDPHGDGVALAGDGDAQRAAVGHRVAGVDGEVHEHLLQARAVGEDRGQVVADGDLQLDELAERAREQRLEVGDERADVEHLGVHDLAAAEHQQLARERGGALGGAADLVDVLAHGRELVQLVAGERDAGQDHRQQVVEVVGDAAGELADALQALGLREALLELGAVALGAAAVGEVRRDRAHRGDVPVGVEQRELHDEQLLLLAVVPRRGRVTSAWRVSPVRMTSRSSSSSAPSTRPGRQRLGGGAAEDGVGVHADGLLVAAVDEQEALARVLDGDQRGRVVDDRLQALLAGALLGLGAAALAEVDQLDEEVQRALAVAVHQRDVREQVQHAPVGVHHPLLDRVAAPASREQLADQRPVEVDVLGMAERRERRRAQVGLGAAGHLRQRAVQAQPAALEVDQRHADRRVVEGAAEELLGGAQRVLDAARLGDVLARAVDDDRVAAPRRRRPRRGRGPGARRRRGAGCGGRCSRRRPRRPRPRWRGRRGRGRRGARAPGAGPSSGRSPPGAGRGCGTARRTT